MRLPTKTLKKFSYLLIFVLFLATSIACQWPVNAANVQPTAIPIAGVLLTPNPNATATKTPYQPVYPTEVPTATATLEPPTPTVTPTGQYGISPVTGQVNILLLGSDYRPGSGFRTDVILLVTLNPQQGSVSVTSFPRDLYINIPGVGEQRINTAQAYGGFELTKATFQSNFGVNIDHYVITNFEGFKSLIDTLGGITVNSTGYLYDRCDAPIAVNGYCEIGQGAYNMDGTTALWYVRSRYSSSDFDRLRRAQEVIVAIFTKLMSLDAINRAPELFPILTSAVQTDLDLQTVTNLLPLAPAILSDPSKIRRYAIGPESVSNYVTEAGAMVLLPDWYAIQSILQQALTP